ncbi:MAG TPA: DEAD/DEAH box helicase [Kofleriaceae bacterium]|jgi:superfamily II DNA or RNA helicase
MVLADLLTRAALRARAGYAFERGERYWRQGRVTGGPTADNEVTGIVLGTQRYAVRLAASGRGLAADCTCPMGEGGAFCKHMVALALHYADVIAQPPAGFDGFATRGELEAWTAEHRVGFELAVAADVLAPELSHAHPNAWGLRRELCLLSLRDVGSIDGARRVFGGGHLQQLAVAAVRKRLDDRAAEVRAGLAEERDRDRHVNGMPRTPSLAATLHELRVQQRRSAPPRSRAARASGHWRFAKSELAIEWNEPAQLRGPTYTTVPVIARLGFEPEPQLACSCGARACTHAIALIDATLDRLAEGDADAHAAADELMRPPWQRALAALAEVGEAARAPVAIEVWWEIEHELRVLTATPIVKRQLKSGKLSAGSRLTAPRLLRDHGNALDARDREIAEQLEAWLAAPSASYPVKAFAAMVGHPRVIADGVPLAVKRAPLGINVAVADGNSDVEHVRVEPSVDGARFSPRLLAPLLAAFAPGEPLPVLEPEHGRMMLVDVADDARRVWAIFAKHGDTFPPEAHAQLFARLAHIETKLPVALPAALLGERLHEPATVVLRLRLDAEASLELEPFVRPAEGAPLYPPGVGPRDVMVARDGKRRYVRRDFDGEAALVAAALARLPLQAAEEGPPGCFRLDDPEAALAAVVVLQSPPPGIAAEWIDGRPRVVPSGGAQQLRVVIDHKRDWFGIVGELKVEQGRIELAILLDAARRQQRFVRIDANRWVELEGALRKRLGELADRSFSSNAGAMLSIAAAPVMRALAEDGAQVDAAPAWRRLAENLDAAMKLRPKPPAALHGILRPYQREGHAWLARLAAWGAGACLADDMGLGKTIQAIALLCDRAKLGPAIVLAPTSVALNWVDELRRFAPTLRPIVYGEACDRIKTLASLGKRDVLVVSYGLLARDAAALAAASFATLVADEAQAIKNPRTERAKAARGLQAEFRVAMSGTPLENHLGELWSLFALVFPGLLGSWEQFRTRFAVPIEKTHDPEASAALARVIKPFLLRRTKAEVAPELPPRTEIELPVALSSEEAELYEDARLAAVARLTKSVKNAEQRRFEVLAALTRLRLLASHPKLYDPSSSIGSSKMQRMLELVEELRSEGHRALVFSQFTSHLALVRAELEHAGVSLLYLDGATPARERAKLIARFQAGECDVFLISLKAGGTGINLTGADYVIHLDPWWNPAVEDQATDRAHRIGQDKPVTVYRLIARNTVEEKILAMHGTKRALVAGVLAGTDAAARLSTRDLVELIAASA